MDYEQNPEMHEMEARKNGLMIALRQTESQAIAHLEAVVGAMLKIMSAQQLAKLGTELAAIEDLSPAERLVVQLIGESPEKSLRMAWREELAAIEAQMEVKHAELAAQSE